MKRPIGTTFLFKISNCGVCNHLNKSSPQHCKQSQNVSCLSFYIASNELVEERFGKISQQK